jgi:hypothetical protein
LDLENNTTGKQQQHYYYAGSSATLWRRKSLIRWKKLLHPNNKKWLLPTTTTTTTTTPLPNNQKEQGRQRNNLTVQVPVVDPDHRNYYWSLKQRFQKNTYCLNIGVVKHAITIIDDEPIMESPVLSIIRRKLVPLAEIKKEAATNNNAMIEKNLTTTTTTMMYGPIDRIYYSNLERNWLRRQSMERWLQQNHHQQQQQQPPQQSPHLRMMLTTTPYYKRINATEGEMGVCVPKKAAKCRGLSGLARTLVGIIEKENTTGLSLVLEDDYVVHDPHFSRLYEAIQMVPNDWDLIRFDCYDLGHVQFRSLNRFVIDTSLILGCQNTKSCFYCGGTHSMLFRGTSVHKLKEMWSTTPYQDVDCMIAKWPALKSYCVQIGLGHLYKIDSELTSIAVK